VPDPHRLQRDFRVILDCFAHPGRIGRLEASAAPPLAEVLLDGRCSFWSAEPHPVQSATGSRLVPAEQADFVFLDGAAARQIEPLRRGTLLYPDESATALVAVESLSDNGAGLEVRLTGPGIATESRFRALGLSAMLLQELREANREYPLGVDVLLYAPGADGCTVAAIPRTSAIAWEER
jgi:alpha-D-ribose 1-methylphosphonate 5-triphosphate synthase subunit PhnH